MKAIKSLLELKDLDTGYIRKWVTALKISTFKSYKIMTDTPQHIKELQLKIGVSHPL